LPPIINLQKISKAFGAQPLDEPTNDLDIPTLEILEESLLEFRGSMVLVTHDRYMLDRVSNIVLGLDGRGSAESFADHAQWESWQEELKPGVKGLATTIVPGFADSPWPPKKKLSYLEAREYAGIEQRIADAEQVLQSKCAELENPRNRQRGYQARGRSC
jgi:ABC transport system ATP-binding/permease protein